MSRPLLTVAGLRVAYPSGVAVADVDFTVAPGECVAVVGRSGAGKSSIAKALLGLSGRDAEVSAGTLDLDGTDLLTLGERQWNCLRGRRIGLVLQDALVSLDPLRTVGRELGEALAVHGTVPRSRRRDEAIRLLDDVHAGHLRDRLDDYPHQLSGGDRQRVLIATALAARPSVLVVDEPVTALDPVARAGISRLLGRLRDEGLAILLISHDLDFVTGLANRVVILDRGRVVETGSLPEVFDAPRTDATAALVAAAPSRRGFADQGEPGPPVLALDTVTKVYPRGGRGVHEISVTVGAGEAVGLVGASGSGKSTVATLALAFAEPTSGTVEVCGRAWSGRRERDRRSERRRIQLVDQDPLSAFDPRHRVRTILAQPLRAIGIDDRAERATRIGELLSTVDLDPGVVDARPRELSGGQRQRLAIARALATRPDVLVCDEPVSALDQVTQAAILDLLGGLRDRGLGLLFISHDLTVVRSLCTRIVVLHDGRIVESGSAEQVWHNPAHPHTLSLLEHTDGRHRLEETSLA